MATLFQGDKTKVTEETFVMGTGYTAKKSAATTKISEECFFCFFFYPLDESVPQKINAVLKAKMGPNMVHARYLKKNVPGECTAWKKR